MNRALGSTRQSAHPIAASVALAAVWFWAGITVALSGIETPIRTRMAEIPVEYYLAIGYRLFHITNALEWFLAMLVLTGLLVASRISKTFSGPFLLATGLVVVFLIQTILLYGPLDARTEMRLNGQAVPAHQYHWLYLAAEVVKFALLVSIGTILLLRLRCPADQAGPIGESTSDDGSQPDTAPRA